MKNAIQNFEKIRRFMGNRATVDGCYEVTETGLQKYGKDIVGVWKEVRSSSVQLGKDAFVSIGLPRVLLAQKEIRYQWEEVEVRVVASDAMVVCFEGFENTSSADKKTIRAVIEFYSETGRARLPKSIAKLNFLNEQEKRAAKVLFLLAQERPFPTRWHEAYVDARSVIEHIPHCLFTILEAARTFRKQTATV